MYLLAEIIIFSCIRDELMSLLINKTNSNVSQSYVSGGPSLFCHKKDLYTLSFRLAH